MLYLSFIKLFTKYEKKKAMDNTLVIVYLEVERHKKNNLINTLYLCLFLYKLDIFECCWQNMSQSQQSPVSSLNHTLLMQIIS